MAMLTPHQQTFSKKWPSMQPVILKLLSQQSVTKQEWQDLFWDVSAVCLWDHIDGVNDVHAALQKIISQFIKEAQQRIKTHHEGNALLRAYIVEWQKFFDQCAYFPKPFETTLNKDYGNPDSDHNYCHVRKMMLDTWNENIFQDIQELLKNKTMDLIEQERGGAVLDPQLIIGVRQSFEGHILEMVLSLLSTLGKVIITPSVLQLVNLKLIDDSDRGEMLFLVNLCYSQDDTLQIYREHFESTYIQCTKSYYKLEAENYLAEHGVREYMKYAHQKLTEETNRATRYLESSSIPSLVEQCVDVLVAQFSEVITSECRLMIRNNESKELNLMLSLFNRLPGGIEPMLNCMQEHIIQQGLSDMKQFSEAVSTDCEKYIGLLLKLYNHFTTMVNESFDDDYRFLTARDKAFEHVVNDHSVFALQLQTKAKVNPIKLQTESRCPELLANFCDMLLRKTALTKKLTTEEIDKKLANVMLLLKYVRNKDVFMRYHKAHLTRRLILGTSYDSEKEEFVVEALRDVGMPADVVNKLARMFQDIKVSQDLNQLFRESRKDKFADIVNIKILNAGAWLRRTEKLPVSLPPLLEDLIPEVEEFYKSQHTGRKLNWNHLMSNGIVTFKTEVGQYDLELTTCQMSILYVWNARPKESLSFESLRLATQLPDADLRRSLWSLVANSKLKRQVLLYEPNVTSPKDFSNFTTFTINHKFGLMKGGNPLKRGKVNLIGRLQLASEKSREDDNEGITQLRILRTQEAIIKIMKMRKRIANAQLQTELVEMLKNMFLPQKKLIKQQIEWLIERKYIARDDEDLNTFIYII